MCEAAYNTTNLLVVLLLGRIVVLLDEVVNDSSAVLCLAESDTSMSAPGLRPIDAGAHSSVDRAQHDVFVAQIGHAAQHLLHNVRRQTVEWERHFGAAQVLIEGSECSSLADLCS